MPALSEYTNVYNTALVILQSRGYQVWIDTSAGLYWAEKDGWDFAADSPTSLLGLLMIFDDTKPQTYSEYWWRKDQPKLYGNLPDRPKPYCSVVDKHK